MTGFKEATREALEFLRNHSNVGSLATVDSSGQPYVSPIYFVMGSEFDLFFLTSQGSNKAKNIKENDRVAFSVGTGPDYIAVMIRGRAVVTDTGEQNQILPVITEHFEKSKASSWPVRTLEDLRDQNLVLYKIVPEKVTFLNINSKEEPKSNADHLYHLLG